MIDHSSGLARTIRILIIALFVCAPAAADSDCLEFVGRWPFGDGATSTEQNPIHTFENRCSYPVSLTVSNADGHHATTARVALGNGHCDDQNVALD